jgi:predicted transposase/invertase (TIGR01784 family)
MRQHKSNERVLISFDYALKRLLRNKANYEVLEGFLSELLMRDVSVKSIGESESNRDHPRDKYNRVDILVEDAIGEILLIELQFSPEMDFLHRMLFGVSKSLVERMIQGDKYIDIKKIYSINIVYFDLGQGEDYIYHGKTRFLGLHRHDELKLSPKQRMFFFKDYAGDIYPEYYILKVNKFDDVAKDTLDEWIYVLKHNAVKDNFTAKGLNKARAVLDRDKLSEQEREAYDNFLLARSKDLSDISTAKDEGREEGIKIGMEKGRIEGVNIGREESRKEREKLEKDLETALAELARLKKSKDK